MKFGIALAQLGGPETLDDVRPFLYNFFVDLIPDNIPVPRPFVRPLAWCIASVRAPYSRRLYASIGGGSPLRQQTQAQAWALAAELRRRGVADVPVYVMMRNWHPFTGDALRRAQADGVTDLLFLPLYPQYSYSTTRSSFNELARLIDAGGYKPTLHVVREYCEHPRYVAAVTSLARKYIGAMRAAPADIHVVFSAHGLPVRYIDNGDPYLEQIQRTKNAVLARLDHAGPAHLSFQSRLGPEKWLEPASETLIARLGDEGAKAVCVVPVAFVSEHVETLNEIDIQYAQVAAEHGIAEFARVCTVRCHPEYIACLADLAVAELGRCGQISRAPIAS